MGGIRFLCKIVTSILFLSCSITGLTDGYSRLSDIDKGLVGYSHKGDTVSKKIVMLNGGELLSRLPLGKTNVVYYYNKYCGSDICVPISLVKSLMPDTVNVYVVSKILDHSVIQESDLYAIFGMDKYYYGSRYLYKYKDKFFDDLTDRDRSREDTLNLYLFNGRTFIKTIPIDYKF